MGVAAQADNTRFWQMKKKTKRRRQWFRRIFKISVLAFLLLSVGIAGGTVTWLCFTVDTEQDARLFEAAQGSRTTRLYYNSDRQSNVYLPVEWESERIFGSESAIWCAYDDIPDRVKNAFLAVEDHRYFEHDGVDWLRTVKAAANQLFGFDDRFGGSTITQQLIKNITGDDEQTIKRKLREMYRALMLEWRFDKRQILELYLNIVPMGENCIGVAAGAERYFGKQPHELSAAEAAALAAVINAPARYNPLDHPENNRDRRQVILREMHRYGMLTAEEYQNAIHEELTVCEYGVADAGTVRSWYTETLIDDVLSALVDEAGYSRAAALRLLYGGGLEIYTLADPTVQSALDEAFSSVSIQAGVQYAGIVVDPQNGDILGIVGSAGEKTGNRLLNYATAPAAPGSAVKPLSVYAPAIDAGIVHSASIFDDVPLEFLGAELRAWPKNSPAVYQGLCDLGTAIATSKNTAAISTLRLLGIERSYETLTDKLGFSSLVSGNIDGSGNYLTDIAEAPLALGQMTYGVSLRELTQAYTTLAGDGSYKKGRTYLAVYDNKGNVLLTNEAKTHRVFKATTASILTKQLEGVVTHGTAHGVRLPNGISVAGKTGTTTAGRDKWFVGYSPYYLCGVWCGSTGATVAVAGKPQLAVFNEVMGSLHRDLTDAKTEFSLSAGVYECRFCRDGGGLVTTDCLLDPRGDRSTVGWFTADTLPTAPCSCHVGVLCGEDGGVIAQMDGTPLCTVADKEGHRVGLLRVDNRSFPIQVKILDAQYVYRPLGDAMPGVRSDTPYFVNTLPKGRYAGISPTADGVQFNAAYLGQREEDAEDPFDFWKYFFN